MERAINIKDYIVELFAKEDTALMTVRENAKRDGLPNIHVPPNVGKLLHCLTKIQNPQKVLEIGTLAGYSTIWIGRALSPTAKIISLEVDPMHAGIAKANLTSAGLIDQVEIRIGSANELMDILIQNNEGPFDMIFIDADKDNYPIYLEKALLLTRSGSLILSDNLIPKEDKIGKPNPGDVEAEGIYDFNQRIASDPRLESILISTIVGGKGRLDALGLSIVK